jgi:hypothetical protein
MSPSIKRKAKTNKVKATVKTRVKASVRKSGKKTKVSSLPFVLKDTYLSLVYEGRTFQLTSAHPTFDKLASAIKAGNWAKVPDLILTAESLSNRTAGKVTIERGVVKYNGKPMHNTLSTYMGKIYEEGKDVKGLVLFMDNLYKNPLVSVQNELFDFLTKALSDGGSAPITDDGCFVAYKAIDDNYKDCYTHTIDNSVGQVVLMPRKDVDTNRHNTCSYGLHFCSRSYLSSFGGSRIIMVKINPVDVISIPTDYGFAKGRCCKYEVVRELTSSTLTREVIAVEGHALMNQALIEVAKDRQDLLRLLLAHPQVKRNIRKGKIAETTIRKMTFGRLEAMYQKFPTYKPGAKLEAPAGLLFGNPLKSAREAAKLTLKQMAMALDITLKQAYRTERRASVPQQVEDSWMKAIQELTKMPAAVSFPKPVASRVSFGRATGSWDRVNVPVTADVPVAVAVEADDDRDNPYEDEDDDY